LHGRLRPIQGAAPLSHGPRHTCRRSSTCNRRSPTMTISVACEQGAGCSCPKHRMSVCIVLKRFCLTRIRRVVSCAWGTTQGTVPTSPCRAFLVRGLVMSRWLCLTSALNGRCGNNFRGLTTPRRGGQNGRCSPANDESRSH